MEYSVSKSGNELKVAFKLSAVEWDEAVEQTYQKNKHKYSVPGFRKGKVPKKALEKFYGEGVFFDDAFNEAFSKAYYEFLDKEKDIEPVDRPGVSIDDIEAGIAFTATVTVRPEVKLGDYKGLKVEVPEVAVTESDIDHELNHARERAGRKVEITDRAVKKDDIVNLDFSGSVDGVKFQGGTAQGYELTIGSGSFIPGFEEQMIGMNIGEVRDVNVEFPKEYHAPDLAGKPAVFEVKVNSISAKQLPELNDEFAKDVSEFATYAEYREDIKKTLLASRQKSADQEGENKLLEQVASNIVADIPEVMFDAQVERMVEDFSLRLRYQGMDIDKYFEYTGETLESFKAARRPEAEKSVRVRLAVEEIIKAENLTPGEAEIDAAIAKKAETAKKSVEDYKKSHNERTLAHLVNELTMEKVMDFLKSSNELVVKKAPKKATTTATKLKTKADGKESAADIKE